MFIIRIIFEGYLMPSLYDFPNFFDLKGIFLFIFNLTAIFKSREGGTTRNWQSNEFDLTVVLVVTVYLVSFLVLLLFQQTLHFL